MADATLRPTKRQRLVEEFEHQGAEGRRTLETISCSICAEPFEDPVSLRDSGHTYCRVCITQALANHARCPLSNAPIAVPRGYGVDSVLVPYTRSGPSSTHTASRADTPRAAARRGPRSARRTPTRRPARTRP